MPGPIEAYHLRRAKLAGPPSILSRLSRLLDPAAHDRADFLELLALGAAKDLDALPKEVKAECVTAHANGAYGWHVMQCQSPIAALRWARKIQGAGIAQ